MISHKYVQECQILNSQNIDKAYKKFEEECFDATSIIKEWKIKFEKLGNYAVEKFEAFINKLSSKQENCTKDFSKIKAVINEDQNKESGNNQGVIDYGLDEKAILIPHLWDGVVRSISRSYGINELCFKINDAIKDSLVKSLKALYYNCKSVSASEKISKNELLKILRPLGCNSVFEPFDTLQDKRLYQICLNEYKRFLSNEEIDTDFKYIEVLDDAVYFLYKRINNPVMSKEECLKMYESRKFAFKGERTIFYLAKNNWTAWPCNNIDDLPAKYYRNGCTYTKETIPYTINPGFVNVRYNEYNPWNLL